MEAISAISPGIVPLVRPFVIFVNSIVANVPSTMANTARPSVQQSMATTMSPMYMSPEIDLRIIFFKFIVDKEASIPLECKDS